MHELFTELEGVTHNMNKLITYVTFADEILQIAMHLLAANQAQHPAQALDLAESLVANHQTKLKQARQDSYDYERQSK